MTHDELIERACRWLANTMRCGLVLAEPRAQLCREQPDAIGWTPRGLSILVECKVSVDDFRADRHKCPRRMPEYGMGRLRFYLTPRDMLRAPAALPDRWGLLEVRGRIVKVVRNALPFEDARVKSAELQLLLARYAWHLGDDLAQHRKFMQTEQDNAEASASI